MKSQILVGFVMSVVLLHCSQIFAGEPASGGKLRGLWMNRVAISERDIEKWKRMGVNAVLVDLCSPSGAFRWELKSHPHFQNPWSKPGSEKLARFIELCHKHNMLVIACFENLHILSREKIKRWGIGTDEPWAKWDPNYRRWQLKWISTGKRRHGQVFSLGNQFCLLAWSKFILEPAIEDLAKRFDIDGVNLVEFWQFGWNACYCDYCMSEFEREHGWKPIDFAKEWLRRADAGEDIYQDEKIKEFMAWKRERTAGVVRNVKEILKRYPRAPAIVMVSTEGRGIVKTKEQYEQWKRMGLDWQNLVQNGGLDYCLLVLAGTLDTPVLRERIRMNFEFIPQGHRATSYNIHWATTSPKPKEVPDYVTRNLSVPAQYADFVVIWCESWMEPLCKRAKKDMWSFVGKVLDEVQGKRKSRGARPGPTRVPAFFITGVYHSVPANFDDVKSLGFNTVICTQRRTDAENMIRFLDAAHKHGFKVIVELSAPFAKLLKEADPTEIRRIVDRLKSHPALLMWYTVDEPEKYGRDARVPKAIRDAYELIRQIDPVHPVMWVTNQPITLLRHRGYRGFDAVGVDVYPVAHRIKGEGLTAVSRWVANARASAEGKPVFGVIQMHRRQTIREKRGPTKAEVLVMAMEAICAGAKGLLFYNYPLATKGARSAVRELLPLLHHLSKSLMAPEVLKGIGITVHGDVKDKAGRIAIQYIAKKTDEVLYLFTVNSAEEPVTATFRLPVGAKAVEVIGERRTLPLHQGKFSDRWGCYHDVDMTTRPYHIYRIKGKK